MKRDTIACGSKSRREERGDLIAVYRVMNNVEDLDRQENKRTWKGGEDDHAKEKCEKNSESQREVSSYGINQWIRWSVQETFMILSKSWKRVDTETEQSEHNSFPV